MVECPFKMPTMPVQRCCGAEHIIYPTQAASSAPLCGAPKITTGGQHHPSFPSPRLPACFSPHRLASVSNSSSDGGLLVKTVTRQQRPIKRAIKTLNLQTCPNSEKINYCFLLSIIVAASLKTGNSAGFYGS